MQGLHLYIGLKNLNDVIDKKEEQQEMPLVSEFVSEFLGGSRDYINKLTGDDRVRVHVEKLTGDRIHVVFGNPATIPNDFFSVVNGISSLVDCLNQAQKMKNLPNISVNMGADFGDYEDMPIRYFDAPDFIEEPNTIGYPANEAAKVQEKANAGEIRLTNRAMAALRLEKLNEIYDTTGWYQSFQKRYVDTHIYSQTIHDYLEGNHSLRMVFDSEASQRSLLSEAVNGLRQKLSSLPSASLNERRERTQDSATLTTRMTSFKGFVIYADIRHSTKLLARWPQGSGQSQSLCSNILQRIYAMMKTVLGNECDHIQVQGDRETAILIVPSEDDKERAEILLRTIFGLLKGNGDIFLSEGLSDPGETLPIGVGVSYGIFHARKIGGSEEKENYLCGSVVNAANDAEGDGAKDDNTIALTPEAYDHICQVVTASVRATVVKLFLKKGDYYVFRGRPDDYFETLAFFSRQTQEQGSKLWMS